MSPGHSLMDVTAFVQKLRVCISARPVFLICLLSFYGQVETAIADRGGRTVVEIKCTAQSKEVPVPPIYQNLEGVALLVHSPTYTGFTGKGEAYDAVLEWGKLKDVFKASISKSILPYVRASGNDCSVLPEVYDIEPLSSSEDDEYNKIIDNPNIATIHVQVTIQRIDGDKNKPVAIFVFSTHRNGFRGALAETGISVIDLNKPLESIEADLERFKNMTYFIAY